jgi:hypothetical protein
MSRRVSGQPRIPHVNESLSEPTGRAMGISISDFRAKLWLLARKFVATDIRG